jgi:hypothetical protein
MAILVIFAPSAALDAGSKLEKFAATGGNFFAKCGIKAIKILRLE